MNEYIQRIKNFIKDENLICEGDMVLAGVSGGADSVCLFYMLSELRQDLGFELSVIHINHMIRQEAVTEAEYVEKICGENQIAFFRKDIDIPKIKNTLDRSEEEVARDERYRAFDETASRLEKEYGKRVLIATAHNMNDQAETVLHNLFRGSRLTGLSGIRSRIQKGDHMVIRPLLELSRAEIEDYLTGKGCKWYTDASNNTDDYTRNRIRHNILPVATEQINKASVKHLAETAEYLRSVDEYLDSQARKAAKDLIIRGENSVTIDCKGLNDIPSVIRQRIFMNAIKELVPHVKDIRAGHISELERFCADDKGSSFLDMPYAIKAVRAYDKLKLTVGQNDMETGEFEVDRAALERDGKYEVFCPGLGTVSLLMKMSFDKAFIPCEEYTKWFDYDKIKHSMQIRRRKTGDSIDVGNGSKTLKKFMIDEKIPADERNKLYVIADESDIIWIPGYRIGSAYKISENTKMVLEVKIYNTEPEVQQF